MNPEIEIERLNISLSIANQCMDSLARELAALRVENRQLRAQLSGKPSEPPNP